jgi:mRNA interferase YafQ
MKKRGKDINKLKDIISLLQQGKELPLQNRDHALRGKYAGCRECHIEPDWLLVYQVINEELVILLLSTGSHSDLF